MAPPTKPTMLPTWTSGLPSQVVAPTPSQQASGFTAGQRPSYQLLNGLLWNLGSWTNYLNEVSNSSAMSAAIDPLMRLIGGGSWSWTASTGVLTWSATAYLAVPGLADSANTLAAGSVTLADGQVAYFAANVPFTTQATTTSGSAQLTSVAYELGIAVGQTASGNGIPANTTVISVDAGTVTLSQACTASGTGVNVTFVGTGALTASSAAQSSLAPGPNTIVFARATGGRCIVGVNTGQFVLRDQEYRLLLEGGFTNVLAATAGQAITARQAVYVSQGGADGRTAGQVYPADASVSQGALRNGAVGVALAAAASGAAVSVASGGVLQGFSGLTPGLVYYVDPYAPGGITGTRPATIGSWVAPVGTAVSATAMLLNPSGAAANQQVASLNPWPQYQAASQSDLVAGLAQCASAGGGVVLVASGFTLSQSVTVPANTLVQGRKGAATIVVTPAGGVTLSDTAELRDLSVLAMSAGSTTLVSLAGSGCIVRGCTFTQSNASTGTCIAVRGNSNRIYNCVFIGVAGVQAIGIAYLSGAGNIDDSTVFLN